MAIFHVTEFNYRTTLAANTMVRFNIPNINFNSNLGDNFAKDFLKLIIWDWIQYTHILSHINTFSPRILSICPALSLHANEEIVELAINIKVSFKLLKTFIKFTYLLSKLRIWRFHFILPFKHHCYQFLFIEFTKRFFRERCHKFK